MNINEIKERFNVYAVKFKDRQQSSIENKLSCPNIQSAEGWNGFVGIGPRSPHVELACIVCPVRLIAKLGKGEDRKSLLELSTTGGKCNPNSDHRGADLEPGVPSGNLRVKKSGVNDDRKGDGIYSGGVTRKIDPLVRNPWFRKQNG